MSALSRTYEPVDKDISCDIDIVTIRTMESMSPQVEPSNNAVLILHRQGFNGCYKPVGLTCSTNGGKVNINFKNMFHGYLELCSFYCDDLISFDESIFRSV